MLIECKAFVAKGHISDLLQYIRSANFYKHEGIAEIMVSNTKC